MKNREIHLTDEQYYSILLKIKKTVDQEGFKPTCDDCTMVGMKHTETNCGLCNDNFTEKETALFPNEFPERKSMKYSQDNHKCPFDQRINKNYSYGCFYHCCLFQHQRYRSKEVTIEELREMVDKTIKEIKK